jgi:predicted phosphoribosyltransferase
LKDRVVILADDGLATGTTMMAAAKSVRALGAQRLIIAVPVGSAEACQDLDKEADELICLLKPRVFGAVSMWYEDFSQTSDEEVCDLLEWQPAC